MDERFSVWQFFPDGSYEKVRDHVPADEAFKGFKHYTTSVGARIGTTVRVIITDSGDQINAEWKHGEGIVFPPAPSTRTKEYQCQDCGIRIVVEGDLVPAEPILCQRCDPAFASLLDNKHHRVQR